MGLFRALKTNARRALAGSWGRAIGIMLISVIPGVLINLLEYGIREVSATSGNSSATRVTVSRQTREVSSTFALSTEVTRRSRLRARPNATLAIRSISGTL